MAMDASTIWRCISYKLGLNLDIFCFRASPCHSQTSNVRRRFRWWRVWNFFRRVVAPWPGPSLLCPNLPLSFPHLLTPVFRVGNSSVLAGHKVSPSTYRVLKGGGCSRGGGNWRTVRIPLKEDWGSLSERLEERHKNVRSCTPNFFFVGLVIQGCRFGPEPWISNI